MSHSIQKLNVGNNAIAVVKIINYVQGGESFTLAEMGLTGSLVDLIFLLDNVAAPPPCFPVYMGGGLVKLIFGGGSGNPASAAEFPATVGLNFVFVAIVVGTN